MFNLSESISIINKASGAVVAKVEAGARLTLRRATEARDAAASIHSQAKAKLQTLKDIAPESLPDSDAAIREHLTNIQVAEVRVSRAEKALADAEAAVAAAQRGCDVDLRTQQDKHRTEMLARAKFASEFEEQFTRLATEAAALLAKGHDLEAWAKALQANAEKPQPLPPDQLGVRIDLLDDKGAILFKIETNAPGADEA